MIFEGSVFKFKQIMLPFNTCSNQEKKETGTNIKNKIWKYIFTAKNTSLLSLFDPLTPALSILNVFDLICYFYLKKNTDAFDPLSIAYLLSNC